MGGGYYHEDVRSARESIGTTRSSESAFSYNREAQRGGKHACHPDLSIRGKRRECRDSKQHPQATPIVVAMDVTGSRGPDAKIVYQAVPSFLGSLKVTDLVPDPQIMWVAVGDAFSDRAPLQVSQFESDRRIDSELEKIWMEGQGGPFGEESYELVAYALARKTDLDCLQRGKKGYLFYTADEAPYAEVDRELIKSYIGDDQSSNVSSVEIFAELQQRFHTYLIFPRANIESDRRDSGSILAKWKRYIPASHILAVEDQAAVVEVMLGIMALREGKFDLDGFIENMKERQCSSERCRDVRKALTEFARNGVPGQARPELFS